jgi:hypothetical protein
MIFDKSKILDSVTLYESLILWAARILQIRTVRDRIQTQTDTAPTAPVSITYDTDVNGVTRAYIYVAIPINTVLQASNVTEWEKALELTAMSPPSEFVKP